MLDGSIYSSSTRRFKLLVAAIILVILLIGILMVIPFTLAKPQSPFPSELKDQTNLTLFYPKKLPQGYSIDKDTLEVTDGVITYAAKKSDKYITFSIQPRAEKFDFNTFYTTTLVKSFKFTTPLGEATVGTMQSSATTVGSIINADTWMIISAPQDVKPSQLQSLVTQLTSDTD